MNAKFLGDHHRVIVGQADSWLRYAACADPHRCRVDEQLRQSDGADGRSG